MKWSKVGLDRYWMGDKSLKFWIPAQAYRKSGYVVCHNCHLQKKNLDWMYQLLPTNIDWKCIHFFLELMLFLNTTDE